MLLTFCILSLFMYVNGYVIKEIDGVMYVGGMNKLSSYTYSNSTQTFVLKKEENYFKVWPRGIMNGEDFDKKWYEDYWPENFPHGPKSLSFDNCLNWKQEHPNETVRDEGYDFPRWYYHSPSGDFKTMNYTCQNSFIKAIEPHGNDQLWVCGTFGAFPKAFIVNMTTLKFLHFHDRNVMSCARYADEPMATYVNKVTKELYVASGWGLYRPNASNPDSKNNNSTVLYSQWRLYRNHYTLPAAMSLVLSSDVNFIDVVQETDSHIYFFGHEINSQYGLNNQDDRSSWQSFMLRICKNDLGHKYVPKEDIRNMEAMTAKYFNFASFGERDYKLAPNFNDIDYIENLPDKHFVTSLKVNFGCFISKRPRAISDNHFWGETNVVYLNKLADVVYDPKRKLQFQTENVNNQTGCNESNHSQIPLLGLFNGPGIVGSGMEPTGALCQLQINENIFPEEGIKRPRYTLQDTLETLNAFEELMALSSTSTPNFYEKTLYRTNGFTMYPWWNQGVMIGRNNVDRNSYKNVFHNIGKCHNKNFYDTLNVENYFKIQNFTNTAWPNELANRMVSLSQAMCQYYAAELLGFNATFIVPGVEFKKMFVIASNITNYVMHDTDTKLSSAKKSFMAPLMIVGIVATNGTFYRVVVCDFDSGIQNHGIDKRSSSWYNWCIFRHTNQPYLYRQFIPMEKRPRGKPVQFRASSLLLEKSVVSEEDLLEFPINRDPQFHVVKGVLRKDRSIHVLTSTKIHKVSLDVICSDYGNCVVCASDPTCMWDITNRACKIYEPRKYEENIFVQDVLDRGFKCALSIIKGNPESIKYCQRTVLQCKNADFWRGKIRWYSGINEIKESNASYIINGHDLYVNDTGITVTCRGVKDDFDKLYDDSEYIWIKNTNNTYESILLNSFKILRFIPEESPVCIYRILLCVSICINAVIIIGVVIVKKNKCLLKKPCKPEAMSEEGVNKPLRDVNSNSDASNFYQISMLHVSL